jgi:vancomycin resistance protein YoaR
VTSTNTTTGPESAKPEGRGGRVVALLIAGLILLFGGLYAAAYAFAGDKLPEGTTVGGVEIGGRSPAQAEAALERAFDEDRPMSVTVDGRPTDLPPQKAGLAMDVPATVESAGGGRSWSPAVLWDHYTGGDEVEPVVVWDEAALESSLTGLDKEFGRPAKEGAVRFEGAEVRRVKARDGREIDRESAREELASAYVDGGTAELRTVAAEPEIDNQDVQAALDEFGNPAVSGAVTLNFAGTKVRLEPRDYTAALAMKPVDGSLEPALREKRLDRLVRSRLVGRDDAPVDATVRIVDGKPKVIPAKPGVDFEMDDVSSAFLDVVARPTGRRQLPVKATTRQADRTTAEARALKIREKISSFTTYYPHSDYRNVNLGRAADLIDGTILEPGETFSLNDTVGERTKENGFTEGYIINNGILVKDYGGGVSQMATTLFNAVFFGGLEDVEHKPHSFYIDRYPVGRESTIAWGSFDFRFRNDSPYGVLIQTHISPSTYSSEGAVTVTFWSTKRYEIESITGERYNHRSPDTRVIWDDPNCEAHTGWSGFDIDVWRVFKDPDSGEELKREKFHTEYTASDHVECRYTPEPEPEPEPTASPKPSPKPSSSPTGGRNNRRG